MLLDDALKYYPYDPDNFRFIGSPVDGIQFEDDRVLFVQFRKQNITGTKDKDRIRTLVETGKVAWFEFMMR
jgi:predicted Holliday junction resolvase-like endonuclease